MSRRRSAGCTGSVLLLVVLVALPFSACDDAGTSTQPPPEPTSTHQRKPKPKPKPSATRRTPKPIEPSTRQTTTAAEPWVDIPAARKALQTLPVKGRAPMTDYSREAFGTAWSDTNDNGCDTRNDILRRDLTNKSIVDCVVMSGVLRDPYSGQVIRFERGPVSSLDVQIDHVVPMGNAWATGAQRWSAYKREMFANDRRNLLAVQGDLNLQKGDGDAATWLPPRRSYRCTYVAMQIQTKQRYGLWVTPAEKSAMQRILASC